MHTVIHLAAEPDSRAGWESVLANNIIGAHNVFEAARQAGVKRVIFASTNQVVFGYGAEEAYRPLLSGRLDEVDLETLRRIDHTQPTRPLSDYGVSKVFGEALAHMYAYTHGLSCLCLRIGWVVADDRVPSGRGQTLWCSQRDIVQLVERCLNAPDSLRFDVFFGQSDNRYNFVDIEHARQVLGYAPQDSARKPAWWLTSKTNGSASQAHGRKGSDRALSRPSSTWPSPASASQRRQACFSAATMAWSALQKTFWRPMASSRPPRSSMFCTV